MLDTILNALTIAGGLIGFCFIMAIVGIYIVIPFIERWLIE